MSWGFGRRLTLPGRGTGMAVRAGVLGCQRPPPRNRRSRLKYEVDQFQRPSHLGPDAIPAAPERAADGLELPRSPAPRPNRGGPEFRVQPLRLGPKASVRRLRGEYTFYQQFRVLGGLRKVKNTAEDRARWTEHARVRPVPPLRGLRLALDLRGKGHVLTAGRERDRPVLVAR